jgi:hypothetical protein
MRPGCLRRMPGGWAESREERLTDVAYIIYDVGAVSLLEVTERFLNRERSLCSG